MDYFMNHENTVKRLLTEYEKHGKLIIAYDFDNTVYDYHELGLKFAYVKRLLIECKDIANFIVFTCCGERKYEFIKEYLNEQGLPFDKINENMDNTPFDGRKIYYNILLDDRAGLESAYSCLNKTKQIIKGEV